MKGSQTTYQPSRITRMRRAERNGHQGAVIWFTGLSGAGKSTLAFALEEQLYFEGCQTCVLDGDNIRRGLCNDLGFSIEDRKENVRRVAEVAKIFLESGEIVIAALIAPQQEDRDNARRLAGNANFIEIYCRCPLEVCEQRDVKGLYREARAGGIDAFTGLSSPYEIPVKPELVLNTSELDIQQCVTQVLNLLRQRSILPKKTSTRPSLVEY